MRPLSAAPRVRTLLGGLFGLVLVLPVVMLAAARVYENQLVRNTEELLIAEAVVVGELYRARVEPEASAPLAAPADPAAERYLPFRPKLDIRTTPVLPGTTRDRGSAETSTAAAELSSILERAIVRNLSGVRVLDPNGVVVASPLRETGYSLAHLAEVDAARRGRYEPALRARFSDEPAPPLSSLSRAANLRVSVAVPIYRDPRAVPGGGGEVLGVVYNQRTPLDVSKALWLVRDDLVVPVALAFAITTIIALLLTATIARPLVRLRDEAEAVARGEGGRELQVGRFAPEEILALSRSLARMRDQLEARAAYVREFAANTAHELKTPLTSLRGASELLLEEHESMTEDQRRRFLSNIHEDAVRMDRLVGRILQLARIELTRPARERVDLRAFLAGVAERYQRHGQDVRVTYEASTPELDVSPEQLDSLVTALADNAARHGAGAPIELSVRDRPQGRELAVRDRGPALPPGHFERVFERFYTTERARGGTGLGLAIVKAIADAHGATVRAEGHPEGGATFSVTFPRARSSE